MGANPLIDIYKNWYNQLNPKERRLLIAFLVVLLASSYVKIFLKPKLNQIAAFKKEEQEYRARSQSLTSQFPNLDKARLELEDIRKNVKKIEGTTKETGSRLINESQVPQLLTTLVKSAQDLSIDFQSAKQKIETDKNGLSWLYIDLKFDSRYEDLARYIAKIEVISPFVKIGEVDISQSKEDPRNLISASLTLKALLTSEAGAQGELSTSPEDKKGAKLSIGRNPLMPSASVIKKVGKRSLKLTGITYRGAANASTAIINDTIVKVGDDVDGQRVENILPDSVIMNDGIEEYTLISER